jgi:transcriptional regulator with XRE-family HTH domain
LKKRSSLAVLGQRIRDARKAKDISQEALALESGIDRSFVGQVERGERNVSFLTLCKLAKVVDCDVAAFSVGLPLPHEKFQAGL